MPALAHDEAISGRAHAFSRPSSSTRKVALLTHTDEISTLPVVDVIHTWCPLLLERGRGGGGGKVAVPPVICPGFFLLLLLLLFFRPHAVYRHQHTTYAGRRISRLQTL
ncbi:hypothetical protein LX36DRAFT_300836 [Colletotrichum falcatum]|nr:hypothetical protein LX36DRAFT_300836 [Colletotrichum falcatum]